MSHPFSGRFGKVSFKGTSFVLVEQTQPKDKGTVGPLLVFSEKMVKVLVTSYHDKGAINIKDVTAQLQPNYQDEIDILSDLFEQRLPYQKSGQDTPTTAQQLLGIFDKALRSGTTQEGPWDRLSLLPGTPNVWEGIRRLQHPDIIAYLKKKFPDENARIMTARVRLSDAVPMPKRRHASASNVGGLRRPVGRRKLKARGGCHP